MSTSRNDGKEKELIPIAGTSPLLAPTLPRSDGAATETGGGSVQGTEAGGGSVQRRENREARGFHNQNFWKFFFEILVTDVKFGSTVLGKWFTKLHDEENWLENIRGYLGTLAGLITTMSFAAALAPPGGVVSASIADSMEEAKRSIAELTNNAPATLPGGEAVLAFIDPAEYHRFLFWNGMCMYCSLIILLLMLSGTPLKHRLMVWLCSALMCLDVLAVGNMFSIVVSLTTPRVGGVWARDAGIRTILMYVWIGALAVVVGVITIRMVYWCVAKCSKREIMDEEVGVGLASVVRDAAGGVGAARL